MPRLAAKYSAMASQSNQRSCIQDLRRADSGACAAEASTERRRRYDPPVTDAPRGPGPDGWVLVAALVLSALLPLIEAVGRPLGFHLSGSAAYLQQVTLWLTFVGGLVATRRRTHLTLLTTELITSERARRIAGLLAAAVS